MRRGRRGIEEQELPNNVAAEKLVLAGIFAGEKHHAECYQRVAEWITPETFYLDSHRELFRAMGEVHRSGLGVTPLTVIDALNRLGTRGVVGQFLDLAAGPQIANMESYCTLLAEKAMLRQMYLATEDLRERILLEEASGELIGIAQQTLGQLIGQKIATAEVVTDQIIEEAGGIGSFLTPDPSSLGLLTPWPRFNQKTNGFKPGEFIVLGGRTGSGKTAAVSNLATYLASQGRRVHIESHEQMPRELLFRMICSEASVDSQDVRAKLLTPQERNKLQEACSKFSDFGNCLTMGKDLMTTVSGLGALLRRRKTAGTPVDLLVIDMLHYLHGMGTFARRDQEIKQIAQDLKGLARTFRIPVLALVHVKTVEAKDLYKHEPTPQDFSDSKAIAESADIAIIVQLTAADQWDKDERRTDLYLVKNRNGPMGVIPFYFIARYTRFTEVQTTGVRNIA